jgi:hypothetical protein
MPDDFETRAEEELLGEIERLNAQVERLNAQVEELLKFVFQKCPNCGIVVSPNPTSAPAAAADVAHNGQDPDPDRRRRMEEEEEEEEDYQAEIKRLREKIERLRVEQGGLDPETELLLHEVDAYDPVVAQAAGVVAVRHYLTLDEAYMLIRYRYPEPDARHDYCAGILEELGG